MTYQCECDRDYYQRTKVIGLLGVLDLDRTRSGEVACDSLSFCRVVSDRIFLVSH